MIAMLVAACCLADPQVDAEADALLAHAKAAWLREPETQIEDAYKWLFHATQGGEHAIAVEEGPRSWFESEWAEVGLPKANEPVTVPLDPAGRVVRVNLRPAKAKGHDPEMVFQIFLRSAEEFRPDPPRLRKVWAALGERLRLERWSEALTRAEWARLDRRLQESGFRAMHHSDAYARAREPAYRVVLGGLWVGH